MYLTPHSVCAQLAVEPLLYDKRGQDIDSRTPVLHPNTSKHLVYISLTILIGTVNDPQKTNGPSMSSLCRIFELRGIFGTHGKDVEVLRLSRAIR